MYNGWTPSIPPKKLLENNIQSVREILNDNPDNAYWQRTLDWLLDQWKELFGNIYPYTEDPDTIAEATAWAYGEPYEEEGSDNSMKGSLEDSGYGEGGVM